MYIKSSYFMVNIINDVPHKLTFWNSSNTLLGNRNILIKHLDLFIWATKAMFAEWVYQTPGTKMVIQLHS